MKFINIALFTKIIDENCLIIYLKQNYISFQYDKFRIKISPSC